MSFIGANQPTLVQATWATPFGTPFFHMKDGEYFKLTMDELRKEYQAWERTQACALLHSQSLVSSWADEVEEYFYSEAVTSFKLDDEGIDIQWDERPLIGLDLAGEHDEERGNKSIPFLVATNIYEDRSFGPDATDRATYMIGADFPKPTLERDSFVVYRDDHADRHQAVNELEQEHDEEMCLRSGSKDNNGSECDGGVKAGFKTVKGILQGMLMDARKTTKRVRWNHDVVDRARSDNDENAMGTVRSVKMSGLRSFRLDFGQKDCARSRQGLQPVTNVVL